MNTTLKIEWKAEKDRYCGEETAEMFVADVRFGIFDSKGREMGVELQVRVTDLIIKNNRDGRLVTTSAIQSCRNGEGFGASFPVRHEQPSVEAAKADAVKRAYASLKKVQRKAAANGGIYK